MKLQSPKYPAAQLSQLRTKPKDGRTVRGWSLTNEEGGSSPSVLHCPGSATGPCDACH